MYGEWVRPQAVVEIVGVPRGRWGVGGDAAGPAAPLVTLTAREAAMTVAGALIAALTAAVREVLGAAAGEAAQVVLIGIPAGRCGVGGVAV